jgi:hypothetical protein
MFVKNKKYYDGIVYEFNLPSGWSCPFASDCLVKVDKETGKFNNQSKLYKCYSAIAERFPAVRKSRWNNFDYVKQGNLPIIPKDCKAVRIHASGDFFNQSYFDMWLLLAKQNPEIEFWAYTKSLKYWVNKINEIPSNLELTASYGGKNDELIKSYNLKNVKVYNNIDEVPNGIPIDYNDNCARNKQIKEFALLNNFKK